MDIELEDGRHVTAHCPNTGSMLGVIEEGRVVGLSHHDDPKRTLAYTLQMIEDDGVMVGVNTHNPNKIVFEALKNNYFDRLQGYENIHKEVKVSTHSRLDFALTSPHQPTCYIEVKNVHYKKGETAYFPDSKTERGQKHISELSALVHQGNRCVMLYIVQRPDVKKFAFADFIDPAYASLANDAKSKGVEMYAYTCDVSFDRISLKNIL